MDSRTCPLCTTPMLATAVNLAQLVALPSQSRFSLRKLSRVVPARRKERVRTRERKTERKKGEKRERVRKNGGRQYR